MQIESLNEHTGINSWASVDLSMLIFAVFYDWNRNNTMLFTILVQTDWAINKAKTI